MRCRPARIALQRAVDGHIDGLREGVSRPRRDDSFGRLQHGPYATSMAPSAQSLLSRLCNCCQTEGNAACPAAGDRPRMRRRNFPGFCGAFAIAAGKRDKRDFAVLPPALSLCPSARLVDGTTDGCRVSRAPVHGWRCRPPAGDP